MEDDIRHCIDRIIEDLTQRNFTKTHMLMADGTEVKGYWMGSNIRIDIIGVKRG